MDYVIPAFDVGMQIAYCENEAQNSGSGTITRIVKPGEKGNAYQTLQGAFDPDMEVRYEIESNSVKVPVLVKESAMWKTEGTLRRNNASLNPAYRPAMMRSEVFTAQAMTTAELEKHEERIYQQGYTPKAIRTSIQKILRESNPHIHIVDFPAKDIPPIDRDATTHRTLTKLLELRDQINTDLRIDIASIAADGTSLDPQGKFGTSSHPNLTLREDIARRDKQYNSVNRQMYSVYAASAFIIHDRNFSSYCRPALRCLPQHVLLCTVQYRAVQCVFKNV
jgi:hypothetical protein